MRVIKSQHCELRQRERGIDDFLLEKIFFSLDRNYFENNRGIAIIYPSFLKKNGVKKHREHIVLIFQNNVLKTLFWSKDPLYLYSKEPYTIFQKVL